MNVYNILGYIGMTLIIISLIPQLIKNYNTRKTNDISIYLPILFICSSGCMIPYALHIKSYQVVAIQSTMCINSFFLLFQIIIYGKKREYNVSNIEEIV